MNARELPRLFVIAAFVMSAASVAMLGATHYYSSIAIDREARQRAQAVVENGLSHYADESARKAVPQTYWDDAMIHASNTIDEQWITDNFGRFLWETETIEGALLLDWRNAPRVLTDRGRRQPLTDARAIMVAAQPLLTQIRAAERKRGLIDIGAFVTGGRIEPIVAHSFAPFEGGVAIVGASLLQPDSLAKPIRPRASILITVKRIDQTVIDQVARRFLLDGPKLALGTFTPKDGRASAVLRDSQGRVIASYAFDSPAPGAEMTRSLMPALLLFALVLLGATAWILRRGQRMAHSLVASEARATHLAFHDPLTGLPNRARLAEGFAKLAARARREKEPFAVLCIDLDLFKAVNDNFGHLAGDELIRIVATTLQSNCRAEDFLARFGGDEFILLQAHSNRDSAAALAERLVASLAQPFELKVGRAFIGASVGVVMIEDGEMAAEEALRRADLAMYAAKERGRNSYAFFDPSFDRAVRQRLAMQTHLHDALAEGGIDLVYQPQLTASGKVIGVEALARWNHPVLGAVAPADFVQVAEETGLIDALGVYTMRRAFQDSRRWPQLRIAVNVSAVQLRMTDFVDRLAALARETQVEPRRVELEITERLLLGDDPSTMANLNRLRALGFRIVLDDFGTGYSSLGYLQRYPIDKVKIDRSFVARLGIERRAEAVVVAIIRLARALGMDVLAEGVETEAQRLCLQVAGCTDIQGFLTGRPMAAEAIDRLLADCDLNQAGVSRLLTDRRRA